MFVFVSISVRRYVNKTFKLPLYGNPFTHSHHIQRGATYQMSRSYLFFSTSISSFEGTHQFFQIWIIISKRPNLLFSYKLVKFNTKPQPIHTAFVSVLNRSSSVSCVLCVWEKPTTNSMVQAAAHATRTYKCSIDVLFAPKIGHLTSTYLHIDSKYLLNWSYWNNRKEKNMWNIRMQNLSVGIEIMYVDAISLSRFFTEKMGCAWNRLW